MKIETMKRNNETIAVVNSAETLVRDLQSLRELLSAVRAETGAKRIALSKSAVSESFFLLSTGLAGAAKASVAQAGAKLAIFGDYSRYLGTDERSFFYESNSGETLFFLPSQDEALEKLAA